MGISKRNKKNNSKDIYFFRPDLSHIDTSRLFSITYENGKLRVQNDNVNCLFSNLTIESFDQAYNDFNRHLNLDFELLNISNQVYVLSEDEKEKLLETIVTNWIYYYTVNNLSIKITRSDFTHPYMVDYVLRIIDEKYGIDTSESLALGAKILRQNINDYSRTVKGRRQFYDR